MKLISSKLILFSLCFLSIVIITEASAVEPVQHFLKVSSTPNILYMSGTGFYDEGTLVTLDEAPEVWQDYKFSGWKIDGMWTTVNPVSILMNRPHEIEAVYTKTTGVGSIVIDAIPRITDIDR